jgi:hypothetical protein
MVVLPPARERDRQIVGDVAGGGLRIGHHRGVQKGLDQGGGLFGLVERRDGSGGGIRHGTVSRSIDNGAIELCTIRTTMGMRFLA